MNSIHKYTWFLKKWPSFILMLAKIDSSSLHFINNTALHHRHLLSRHLLTLLLNLIILISLPLIHRLLQRSLYISLLPNSSAPLSPLFLSISIAMSYSSFRYQNALFSLNNVFTFAVCSRLTCTSFWIRLFSDFTSFLSSAALSK